MFNRFVILIRIMALTFSQSAFAAGHIGFNYSQIIDDHVLGCYRRLRA